jgi:hypothetical protein
MPNKEVKKAVAQAGVVTLVRHPWKGLAKGLVGLLLGFCSTMVAHSQSVNGSPVPGDETIGGCLSSELNLMRFATPEKTWAFFLHSLHSGNREAALSTMLAGDLEQGLSALLKSMSAEKMRAMADSFGALTNKVDMGNLREYLVIRKMGQETRGSMVEFEFHSDCGGWRITAM